METKVCARKLGKSNTRLPVATLSHDRCP
jgi:hypothetical protein